MTESEESMTETMPLGFKFNKQFKSQYLQGNILLMLQTALFFYANTQLANTDVLVAFLDLFLSIKHKQQTFTFHFFLKLVAAIPETSIHSQE